MLLTVLSPAKTLDLKKINYTSETTPLFMKEAGTLAKIMKKHKVRDIANLMGISQNLSELNYERYQVWQMEHGKDNCKPCIFTFNGDVYEGLQAASLTENEIEFAQNSLRILSGMYGVLRPLDLIQPYRLEMGIKLETKKGKNLYEFWEDKITKYFIKQIKENQVSHFVNLASDEYSKAIDFKRLKVPVITPTFKEEKENGLQFVSFYAKKARGLMTRYLIQNRISSPEDLKGFNFEGYRFNEKLSNDSVLLFTR